MLLYEFQVVPPRKDAHCLCSGWKQYVGNLEHEQTPSSKEYISSALTIAHSALSRKFEILSIQTLGKNLVR